MPRTTGSQSVRFGADAARHALELACEMASLDSRDASLIRLGENALFLLPQEVLVVRIARTMDYWADAVKEVQVSQWLAAKDFPGAETHPTPQPVEAAGHPVTFWRFIAGRVGNQGDVTTLGTMLRRLHAMPRPTTFELPPEDILGRVEPRIETASIPRSDKDFLLQLLRDLSSEVRRLQYPMSPAPTHGDAHTENLMFCGSQPVLIDFERFAWGQPEWDLAMSATEYVTAGWWTDAEYRAFTNAYGYDVMSWHDGFDVLRAVHELKMTTWLMQNVSESDTIADEFRVRIDTIRRGQPTAPWRPF